jgi:glycoprotein endo-alpha-1,2-mannosidase
MKIVKGLIFGLLLIFLFGGWFTPTSNTAESTDSSGQFKKHTVSPGLVMAGYQGWFNTPDDGAQRGWHHYERKGRFEPGYCTIDLWPDMKEYKKTYPTSFHFEDGTPATVFSPHDESTVDLHFKWMKDYGIDGVFMQRFVVEIKSTSGKKHFNKVLQSAAKAALKYDRTISVMYDLSGMNSGDVDVLINDWKEVIGARQFTERSKYSNYLVNEGKPVIAIWGVGFDDGRKYNLSDIERLIEFFKSKEGGNCSILLGVPTYWREQGRDCIDDEKFLDVIQLADIIHPWFVGRFKEDGYDRFKSIIGEDLAWCQLNEKKYMPVVFPGFSWNNMLPPGRPSSTIPRNEGSFLWKQLNGATSQGAQMIYVAMFDEIDEGTAIFKIARDVPVGESKFVPLEEGLSSDYYLWLTGEAARMMKAGTQLPIIRPEYDRK